MTTIRPLESSDLAAVASLYEKTARSGSSRPPPLLASAFGHCFLHHAWVDPEIPSLVCVARDHAVIGFIGSSVRRASLHGDTIRLGYTGPMFVDPQARSSGIGALLLRRYWAGPQDASITDGATDQMSRMWLKLGGISQNLTSLEWMKWFRPAAFAASSLADRLAWPPLRPALLPFALPVDAAFRRVRRERAPIHIEQVSEDLSSSDLLECGVEVMGEAPLRPAYDAAFLEWLLAELRGLRRRGRLAARLVRDGSGRRLGWHISLVRPNGAVDVLQVAATEGSYPAVLGDLFGQARATGATAVYGRLEPHLLAPLVELGFSQRGPTFYRRGSPMLVHSRRPELLDAVARGGAFLSRLDGEWWLGLHSERYRTGGQRAQPGPTAVNAPSGTEQLPDAGARGSRAACGDSITTMS